MVIHKKLVGEIKADFMQEISSGACFQDRFFFIYLNLAYFFFFRF
jgi:hypothetical protein